MIDLIETLSHLPDHKVGELETITQQIVDTGMAEIVVLFGSYARGNYKEQRGKVRGKKSDYDILAVTSDTDSRNELRAQLGKMFKDFGMSVQVIVEAIDFVNSRLKEKQYFFTDIKQEGKVLFNSGKHQLVDFQNLTSRRRREIAEEDFKQWFKIAQGAIRNYEHNLEHNDFAWASFHLQQAVEMCYTAIEMVFTHYNPHEHYLKILRERVLKFDQRLKEVLPRETKEQQELFDYLDYAYIGGRYKNEEEFPVTEEQLAYWSKEARKLLCLTEIICEERVESFKKIEQELKTN